MGCKGAKQCEEAVEESHTQVPQSWSELDEKSASSSLHHLSSNDEDQNRRGSVVIDSALINKVLKMMGASREQRAFFDVWAKRVHDPALQVCERRGQQLFISTDMRFLEVRVTGESSAMQELLRSFASRVKDLPTQSLEELDMVLKTLQAGVKGKPLLTVWCRFKHCRSDAPPPSVDCGYLLNQDMAWAVIDVMMPSHEDQDSLRDYAQAERHAPVLYGSSILPIAAEKQIGFELHETAAQNSRQILLTAFFFFKALGLMKPEDRIVRILNSCQSEQLVVCLGLGPEGLVRLALSLIEPKTESVAKQLAEELGCAYREKDCKEILEMMNGQPDIIDYVGETKGYGVRMGFTV